jgi:protein phosphatase
MAVRSAGKSHIGRKRKLNEDTYAMAPELGLYVIADGMGGHRAGDVASRLVVETMLDYWRKARGKKPPAFLKPMREDLSEDAKHLVNSIVLSNMIVHEAQKKPQYHRMGSTVAALLDEGDCIWAANVGDSPIYLHDEGRLIMLSEEHSLEAEQRSLGLIDPFGSTNPTVKNLLTRVLGLNKEVEVFITPIRPDVGDIIMICSDGLTNYMSERSINTVLDDFSISIERKVDILVQEANRAGGGDNISVILLEVVDKGKWQRLKSRFGL